MTTTWNGCYDDSWRGDITDESFAHPAKMARGLVTRIFDYLNLPRGSVVVDPFGGGGTTGLIGAGRGLRCFASELEPKFHCRFSGIKTALQRGSRIRRKTGQETIHALNFNTLIIYKI